VSFLIPRIHDDAVNPFFSKSVLDPRISTQTFEADFNDDADMLAHINDCKAKLRTLYDNYTSEEPPHTEPSTLESLGSELPTPAEDELEEYFQLAPDTSGIDPVKWWSDRSSSFPNLSRLARNVLSIPGEFLSSPVQFELHPTPNPG
jgi:hypothetical protein